MTHVGHTDAPNDGVLSAGMARRVLVAMEEERAQENAGADPDPTRAVRSWSFDDSHRLFSSGG